MAGFEVSTGTDGGGIMATGNYPGRARNGDEARADLDEVLSLLPGAHKLNVHAFYTGYSLTRKLVQCLDMGHFHPTEMVSDKISALLQFHDKLLIHTSRPIRWDSDHVVLFNDDVRNVFLEIARGGVLDRIYVALDFFDASINRIAAYVIGTRATRKAILAGLLDPTSVLQDLEATGRLGQKLALMEEQRTMPFGAIWNMLCRRADTPVGAAWIREMERYEAEVLSTRC